jgi:hypothetical protein
MMVQNQPRLAQESASVPAIRLRYGPNSAASASNCGAFRALVGGGFLYGPYQPSGSRPFLGSVDLGNTWFSWSCPAFRRAISSLCLRMPAA